MRNQEEIAARVEVKRKEAVTALQLLLDAMDYERGACKPTERVGAVVPVEILRRARVAAGMT